MIGASCAFGWGELAFGIYLTLEAGHKRRPSCRRQFPRISASVEGVSRQASLQRAFGWTEPRLCQKSTS
jgi:hypothetical protein